MRSLLLVFTLTAFAHADDRGGARRPGQSTATVTMGTPTVNGDLAIDVVRRYILRNRAKYQYCYARALRAKPTLAGVVRTKFEIGGDGNVTAASATGVDPEVSDCFASVIKRTRFPRPGNETSVAVTFPFSLNP
jgi:hypothetical protein